MKTPWQSINALKFMKEMTWNEDLDKVKEDLQKQSDLPIARVLGEGVVLRVRQRPDVASRYWWELEWTGEDGERKSASAQTFELLFERAVEIEIAAREREKQKQEWCS